MAGLWWMMSFSCADRGWLGAVVTEADTLSEAITWTHLAGINPGGEILPVPFRSDHVDPIFVDRLITDDTEWLSWPGPVDPTPVEFSDEVIGTKTRW